MVLDLSGPNDTAPSLGPPFVSVVIPVFESQELSLCLQALEEQTYPSDRFEVIVVDNGVAVTLEPTVASFPHVRLLHEPQPGSYAARNLGVAHARGALIAFTDADCVPAIDWIERGVDWLLHTPGCGLVAGHIDVLIRRHGQPNAVELHDLLTAFRQHDYASRHYGATANVFTRRAVFDAVGPFDAHLLSGGDRAWGQRVQASGFRVVYAPNARVGHPARARLGDLHRKKVRVIGGEYALSRASRRAKTKYAVKVARNLLPPVRHTLGVTRDRRLRGVWQRLQVAGVIVSADYAQAAERLRLSFGGRPLR